MNELTTALRRQAADPLMARATRILRGHAAFDDRYVPDHEELIFLIDTLRRMGCAIAFVTGVWDLFHIGHGDYLHRGKEEAQKLYPNAQMILVVGVDTDELTRERKEDKEDEQKKQVRAIRPVVPLLERARVVAHLRVVDLIVPQYEANQLFRVVSHDVRIISTSTKDLPDLPLIQSQCEHLVNLPPQAETSTTARIRKLTFNGQYEALQALVDELGPVLDRARAKLAEVGDELTK